MAQLAQVQARDRAPANNIRISARALMSLESALNKFTKHTDCKCATDDPHYNLRDVEEFIESVKSGVCYWCAEERQRNAHWRSHLRAEEQLKDLITGIVGVDLWQINKRIADRLMEALPKQLGHLRYGRFGSIWFDKNDSTFREVCSMLALKDYSLPKKISDGPKITEQWDAIVRDHDIPTTNKKHFLADDEICER